MIAEIMSSASFGEICFLVAFVLFAIEFVMRLGTYRRTDWHYGWILGVAGLAFLALGWLALPTGG